MKTSLFLGLLFCLTIFKPNPVSNPPSSWDFDEQLQSYFVEQTNLIVQATAEELAAIEDWPSFQKKARQELLEMLGLRPIPSKTPLKPVITGVTEHEAFLVEKLHFQSMPGLYVTGNLYIPKNIKDSLPAILYVCGHANVKENGISYGAKVNYHHHAAWFARHGYICLIIDTLQLGEIEGIHHGTYRYDRWWWLSRGYTPSGVEAWNGIRAVDYLVSRPEVDASRIGVTGRSGGGINSWWAVALDDRVKAAVPVAGITDLTNHVVDGCVEGHCDCMYLINTHRWDYAKLAALAAPRPLLISNTDQDEIYPIDGVFRTYRKVRGIYETLDAKSRIALNTAAGPHKDLQELRVHAFRWFNHYLKGEDDLIEKPAVKFFKPEQLRVFDQLPEDEINTRIDEIFVPQAPSVSEVLTQMTWKEATAKWRGVLNHYAFAQPKKAKAEIQGSYSSKSGHLELWSLATDEHTQLPLFRLSATSPSGRGTLRIVLDDNAWKKWSVILESNFPDLKFWNDQTEKSDSQEKLSEWFQNWDEVILLPMRGAGPAKFSGDKFKQTQIKRRFYLLGQTLEELQTLDIVQGLQVFNFSDQKVQVRANDAAAGMLVYASLFVPQAFSLHLNQLPFSHHNGPTYLTIMRNMDLPVAALMAAERHWLSIQVSENPTLKEKWAGLETLAKKYPALSLEVLN